MKVETHILTHYTRVAVSGSELDASHSRVFKEELLRLNQQGVKYLLADLSEVHLIDDNGLGVLLIGARLCRNAGGRLVTVITSPTALDRIEEKGLQEVLTLFTRREEGEGYISALVH